MILKPQKIVCHCFHCFLIYLPWSDGTWFHDAEWKVKVKSLSHVRLFTTPWTVACQAPPSMGFSRQEYWSGWPFPSPGDLPDPGIEHTSPALQAYALTSEPPRKPMMQSRSFLKRLFGSSLLSATRGNKEPLEESGRGEWKSWLKTQHSKN